eukprot:1229902-Prymnesium_polylepis.1
MATTRACGGAAPLPNGAAVPWPLGGSGWPLGGSQSVAKAALWAALRAPREGIWDRVGSGR